MKRRNMSKSIAQKGGLMIEALAMLGLIAVVTPTMYKKSAERTMEVEDINTASTIRTIMNAANDFVGANYSTIISDMEHASGDAKKYRKVTFDQISSYLPYGFNMKKALYNYGDPEIAIARKDNNLTAFVLFPAKANADNGIGQERTSRIASLVGSSGGFVTEKGKTARGIGGVWKLDEDDYKGVFPTNATKAEEYSIVTASADTINSATNNEVDMDKYLQRGRDAGDTDNSSLWKNTMRTDLYMGDTPNENDVYNNDDDKGKHSIRNVRSMIIGAEYANGTEATDDDHDYGLYITGDKPNTYIGGSIYAAAENFFVDGNRLNFGRKNFGELPNNEDFNFSIQQNGDTSTRGQLTVDKNVYLANASPDTTAMTAGWDDVKIGNLGNGYAIQADAGRMKGRGNAYSGHVSIIDPNIADFNGFTSSLPGISSMEDNRIVLMNEGYTQLPDGTAVPEIKYTEGGKPTFPVRIGSNAEVEGVLAAGQLDTQKLRTASLSVGSENIDDENKWMTVDADGVLIANPENREAVYDDTSGKLTSDKSSTRVNINKDQIALSVDSTPQSITNPRGQEESDHSTKLVLDKSKANISSRDINIIANSYPNDHDTNHVTVSGNATIIQAILDSDEENEYPFENNLQSDTLVLRNSFMQAWMQDDELTIGPRAGWGEKILDKNAPGYPVRTRFNGGSVDVENTNFNVYTKDDAASKQVFSVRTERNNDNIQRNSPKNTYADNYDVTMHGKVLITNEEGGKVAAGATDAETTNKAHKLISIGGNEIQTDAGINIIQRGDTITNNHQNILTIEQGATHARTENSNYNTENNTNIDDGTIYIRKGFVEIHGGDVTDNSKIGAFDGKGVLAASRFVANNSPYTGDNGETIPKFLNTTDYDGSSTNRYDTYMVNPAYTSVMHDIKLTTRGGARLSDVLPDFINKGIYVVNNTVEEKDSPDFEYNADNLNYSGNEYGTYFKIAQDSKLDKDLDLAGTDAWASPFLGVVPAPQCPPGYGRVITLTPASFQVGQAGKLMQTNPLADVAGAYYVVPNDGSSTQLKDSVNDLKLAYEQVGVSGTIKDSNNQDIYISSDKVATAKYVLTSFSDTATTQPVVPLTFQQSTWLKSVVKPMIKDGYPQGWAAIMGFIYPSSLYNGAKEAANKDFLIAASTSSYWNLFPVVRGSLEGYATVYCYFDRTNSVTTDYKTGTYEEYVDSYSYMKDMNNVPSDYSKVDSDGKGTYLKRLNDPNMKYDEVW